MSQAIVVYVFCGLRCQPCFTVTDLLLLPGPHMRYKRCLRQRSRTQNVVLLDLSSQVPLIH